MKKIIFSLMCIIFIIGIISAASINTYYTLNINYNKSKLTLLSSEIEQLRESINNSFGEYSAKIYDYNGNLLKEHLFGIQREVLYDEVDENGTIYFGGEVILDEVNFTLFIPYYENASKIIIYYKNTSKKLEIDVSSYSKNYEEYKEFITTNQNVSNEEESANKGNVSVNESAVKEKTFVEKISHYWWILLIILIILLAILINSIRK